MRMVSEAPARSARWAAVMRPSCALAKPPADDKLETGAGAPATDGGVEPRLSAIPSRTPRKSGIKIGIVRRDCPAFLPSPEVENANLYGFFMQTKPDPYRFFMPALARDRLA